jgi:3-hydroxyisobutyrate dehydrogenase-like beta-hydroxyacid dehydrogenase
MARHDEQGGGRDQQQRRRQLDAGEGLGAVRIAALKRRSLVHPSYIVRRSHFFGEEAMKVGFIGVGNMGGPMCRNIIKRSNHQVTVFDLNPAAVKTCTDLGGTAAKSVAEVTKGADVVMTSLPMPKDVEAVTLGDTGILASIAKGQTYIDLSTNAPSMVKKIGAAFAAKGIAMLDAPVSGGTTGAEAATIAIMVGGDKKVFDDALPVLQSFSANVIHMGGLGTGTVAKLVNNMLSFCNMAALCEGMMLGTTYGLDPEKLLHVIAKLERQLQRHQELHAARAQGPLLAALLRPRSRLQGPASRARAWRRARRAAAAGRLDPQPAAPRQGHGLGPRRQLVGPARVRDDAAPQGQDVSD